MIALKLIIFVIGAGIAISVLGEIGPDAMLAIVSCVSKRAVMPLVKLC